jgi:hypothetical protein
MRILLQNESFNEVFQKLTFMHIGQFLAIKFKNIDTLIG